MEGTKNESYSSNGLINRPLLKQAARTKLSGNLWIVWKPLLIMVALGMVLGAVTGVSNPDEFDPVVALVEVIGDILAIPLSAGLTLYILNFIRGKECDINCMFTFFKKGFLELILISLVTSIFVILWSILLIIPGIIAAISYSMVMYIYVDGVKSETMEVIKESKRMMYGHKWEYFVFNLSFLGWVLLIPITLGIAAIYVIPYMSVAQAMYFDELKKITKE